jgi:hypothetical protein
MSYQIRDALAWFCAVLEIRVKNYPALRMIFAQLMHQAGLTDSAGGGHQNMLSIRKPTPQLRDLCLSREQILARYW